jgi:hypothetical protein
VLIVLARGLFQVLALAPALALALVLYGFGAVLGPAQWPARQREREPVRVERTVALQRVPVPERPPDAQRARVPEQRCVLQQVPADGPVRWLVGPLSPLLRPGEPPALLSRDERRCSHRSSRPSSRRRSRSARREQTTHR